METFSTPAMSENAAERRAGGRSHVSDAADMVFQERMLVGVSRTFALTIPQAVDYPSLNLGQAVVCTCVELFGAIAAQKKQRQPKLAKVEEMARLYERIESALRVLGYRDVPNRNLHAAAMRTLKHVLGRAALRPGEARSLHGLFRRVEILGEKKGRKKER